MSRPSVPDFPERYLPWSWIVSPTSSTSSCPSPVKVLGTFAIVNVLVSLSGLIFGHRFVINKLSCGYFATSHSRAWRYNWTWSIGLQLGAKALVAYLIKRTPGYENSASVGILMLFFAARPRLSSMFLGFLSSFWRKDPLNGRFTGAPVIDRQGYEPDYYWLTAALSQHYTEITLVVVALYTVGRTANFAATNRFYIARAKSRNGSESERNTKIMYTGALLFLIFASSFILLSYTILACVCAFGRKSESGARKSTMASYQSVVMRVTAIVSLPTTYLVSWLFWGGFVHLAGDLYCPPNLLTQAVIWVTFSGISMATA